MSFGDRVRKMASAHIRGLDKLRDQRVARATDKAKGRLAKANSRNERGKVIQQLNQARLKADREFLEARNATRKAQRALAEAKRESGDVGVTGAIKKSIAKFAKGLTSETKPKRRVTKRKAVRKSPRRR